MEKPEPLLRVRQPAGAGAWAPRNQAGPFGAALAQAGKQGLALTGRERSDPGGEPNVSFSWHCDGGPTKHLKVLLYLNGSDEHGGNTRFLDRATTDAFKKIGYVFCDIDHRLDDLAALAGEHGIAYRPLEAPMRTGEAILFEPANVLHKGVWPTRAPRYLLQICIVPSPMPWRGELTECSQPNRS